MKVEEDNRKKYVIPGGSNYQLRSKNAVYISPSNSVRHKLAKCLGAYMLRKWGDVKFSKALVDELFVVDKLVNFIMGGFPKEKTDFITECCPKKHKDKRRDLVRLSDNWIYEFETDKRRAKRFEDDPEKDYLSVVMI